MVTSEELSHWPRGTDKASTAADLGFIPIFHVDIFLSCTSDLNIGTPVATLPGINVSMLGLVGQVPVDYDWVR